MKSALIKLLMICMFLLPVKVFSASTDAKPIPQKNIAFRVTFTILDNDGDPVTAAAGLDSESSCDSATAADLTNEATEIATSTAMYYLDITSGEMNCDTISINVKTTTTDAKTTVLVMYPAESGDFSVQADDTWDEAQSGHTTAGTFGKYLDTEVSGAGGGSDRLLMVDTTIATLASQTSFTLTAGSADNNAYRNATIVIEDVTTSTQKAIGLISAYTGSTKTVTLKYDPAVFTMAATDKVYILAENALKSTVANRQLDVTATGAAGIDWANVENPTTVLDLSGTDIQLVDTVTTYTGNTLQTGDSYLGATAHANLVLMYDGTGYTANSAPASRSQVDGISGGSGGSINREPSYDNTTTDSINSGGAAVDKGDGTVGIPVTGHAFVANLQVTIANTVNYNGSFTVESQTTNEVVITSSFTSETFGADDTIISTIKTIPFVGTVTSGTFASVATEDGVVHDLADDTDVIDIAYGFAIGGGRTAAGVTVVANVNGNTDEILIKAYDFVGTTWDTVGVIGGSGGSSFIEVDAKLLLRHTGTGSDLGNVFIRLDTDTTTPSQLEVDLLLVSAVSIGQSVGYANGQLWLDTVNGVLGSEPFVNCVADNPCKTLANVKTLSGTVGISDFHIINGSTVTLVESTVNESYFGDNWTLALGGQDVADAYFQGPHVSGIGVSATEVHYEGCDVSTMSVQIGHFDFCSFSGTVTHTLAGDYNYHNSYSKIPGVGSPIFTKTAGQTITAQWRGWAGSITVSTIEAGDVMTISGTELGDIVLNGVDGTVKILGEYESLTDNRTGSPVQVLGAFNGSNIALIEGYTDDIGPLGAGLSDLGGMSTGMKAEVNEAQGYAGGIHIDTNASNTNTVDYVDGIESNPVSTIAAANTLSTSLGINDFRVATGSTMTFVASHTNQSFIGSGTWTLALGGQDIGGSIFTNVIGSGIGTGAPTSVFKDCMFNNVTLPGGKYQRCGLAATFTASGAANYYFVDSYSMVAGVSTPTFDFGTAIGNTNLNMRNYSGGIQLESMGNTGTDTASIEGQGQVIEGTNTGGTVAVRGNFTVSGITNLTLSDDARIDVAQINDEADAALSDVNLDHIVGTATGIPAIPSGTYIDQMQDDGTAVYDRSTDSLQAIRDRGDAAWVTGAGGDPWVTALPGAYGAGTAGKIIGDNIDSPISTAQTDLDTITDSDGVILGAAGVDLVWDEVLSMMAHNVGQSGAKMLRQSSDFIQISGTVSDVSPTTTDFDTDLTQVDTYFADALMVFSNGSANAGIGKIISTYVNASGHVTFVAAGAWPVMPINGDDFVIVALHEHPITEIQAGLATEAKQDIIDTNVDSILTDTADMQPKLGTPAGTDMSADIAENQTDLNTIITNIAALNDISVADIKAMTIEGVYDLGDVLCVMSAILSGKLSTSGGVGTFRGLEDTEDRAAITVATGGNRTAVTLDLTGCN